MKPYWFIGTVIVILIVKFIGTVIVILIDLTAKMPMPDLQRYPDKTSSDPVSKRCP